MRIERRGERGAAARIDIDMPASITARRTPRYDSTWYIPGTFNMGENDPMEGGRLRWTQEIGQVTKYWQRSIRPRGPI